MASGYMASDVAGAPGACPGLNMLYEVAVAAFNPGRPHQCSMQISSSGENGTTCARTDEKCTQTEAYSFPAYHPCMPHPYASHGTSFGGAEQCVPAMGQHPGMLIFYTDPTLPVDGMARIASMPAGAPSQMYPPTPWVPGFPATLHHDTAYMHPQHMQRTHSMQLPSAFAQGQYSPYTPSLMGPAVPPSRMSASDCAATSAATDNAGFGCYQTALHAPNSAAPLSSEIFEHLQSLTPCLADTLPYRSFIPGRRQGSGVCRLGSKHTTNANASWPATDGLSSTAPSCLKDIPPAHLPAAALMPARAAQLQDNPVGSQCNPEPGAGGAGLGQKGGSKQGRRVINTVYGALASNSCRVARDCSPSDKKSAQMLAGPSSLPSVEAAPNPKQGSQLLPAQGVHGPAEQGLPSNAPDTVQQVGEEVLKRGTSSGLESQGSSEISAAPKSKCPGSSVTQHSDAQLVEPAADPSPSSNLGQSARRPRAPNNMCERLTLTQLASVFHLPAEQAAIQLGVGQTLLKRVCRASGITRWPYRKVNSLKSLIQPLLAPQATLGPEQDKDEHSKLVAHLAQLRARRAARVKSLGPFQLNLEQLLAQSAHQTAVHPKLHQGMEVDEAEGA